MGYNLGYVTKFFSKNIVSKTFASGFLKRALWQTLEVSYITLVVMQRRSGSLMTKTLPSEKACKQPLHNVETHSNKRWKNLASLPEDRRR